MNKYFNFDSTCEFIEVEESLQNLKESSAGHAQNVIDEYYDWWKHQNKEALNLKSLGEKISPGKIAPFIRLHSTNNKIYITWVLWPSSSPADRARHVKTYCKHIKPWPRGYTREQLVPYCQKWEILRVLETEYQLSLIREVIDCCHKSLVEIKKIKRVHKKREKNKSCQIPFE